MIIGSANAVNLTDGLDGLAIVPVLIVASSFAFISYVCGNLVFANYLQITFIPGSGELAVMCGALVGSALGFLWFNAPPAKVFMGDVGSTFLGAIYTGVLLESSNLLQLTGLVYACSELYELGLGAQTQFAQVCKRLRFPVSSRKVVDDPRTPLCRSSE